MNTTFDRMLISVIFGILIALVAWLLQTVSANNGRISVLEMQNSTLTSEMKEMRDDIKIHRRFTEGVVDVDGSYTAKEYWDMHARMTAQLLDERAAAVDKALQLSQKQSELRAHALTGWVFGIAMLVMAILSYLNGK